MAISKRLRFEVLRRDGHRCRYCGAGSPDVALVVDHVLPETLGGRDEASNLVTSCEPCNSGKSSSLPDAAHVAAVDQDAARWAEAIRSAAHAMLAERQLVADANEWFREEWNSWRRTRKSPPHPLPNDWAENVERFRSLGLLDDLIVEAVAATMQRAGVDDRWRYFCGVAWRMVHDLQERARGYVTGVTPLPRSDRAGLLEAILDRCDPPLPAWEYDRIVLEFREALTLGAVEV